MLLITGSKGQLGTVLSKRLSNAILTDVDTLDITNERAVKAFVTQNNIDTIINCAAYTAVDKAEEDEALCTKINVNGARHLAKTGAKMIHISTDYVFDGKNNKPYIETDIPNPLCVYGKTKHAGEQAVLNHTDVGVIIRTAWMYSTHGHNFVRTMRKLGTQKESINVVCDQIGTPTYADDLAKAIVDILPQLNKNNKGIYHFSNEGVCSWYDFACEIMTEFGLKCAISPIPSSAYPTQAPRPFYSVLDKTKIKSTFGIMIPHWKESLTKCLTQFSE